MSPLPIPSPPALACIGLGSNLGDRAAVIHSALGELDALEGVRLVASSSLRETPAVRVASLDPGGPFLNAAALVFTTLSPRELLTSLHAIEAHLGRDRDTMPHGGPRTIDLDLLLYGEDVIDEPGLTVPHPRLHERAFALAPLAEIAHDLVIPTLGVSVGECLARLTPDSRLQSPESRVQTPDSRNLTPDA
ncbi:MAG: 2-amino-4-hydroxy-6-hydroxymethyldihydropteridine diphosphokinase [Phycisphaerales bacterium]